MRGKINPKKINIYTGVVFFVTFLTVFLFAIFLNQSQIKEAKMKATYTAESTVNRIESQLDQYLVTSDFLKNVVEEGYDIEEQEFDDMCRLLQDSAHVIEAFELAPDGVVSMAYPLEGNEEAIGLDMLSHPQRKKEAQLAKESGQYTIAGPFELVQGGTGALLFDPIYTENPSGEKSFWGFSLLVLNWDKFVETLNLESLEAANYHYQIWKHNMSTNENVPLAQCADLNLTFALEVACDVPNDTWYFEISPQKGWLSVMVLWWELFLAFAVAALLSFGYWQFGMQRYKEQIYAEEIEKSAEKARLASEAKSRFLFNMSHDIRTPMNAIIGFAELLEKHMADPVKSADYIQKIKSSSEFLLSLINDILEMSRIESGKAALAPTVVDARKLMESLEAVFEPAMRKKNLTYSCNLQIAHEHVVCDETKLREIFLNILGNSVKYTPDGGKISLSVFELPSSKEGEIANRIVIEDTGIGMSPEYLPHIFEEFTRERTSTESKIVGTGLGLPIVKSLVELMDGTIKVESEKGKGTRTTIELSFLPASQEQIQELRKKQPTKSELKLGNKRILLAEDNDLNAEIAITILEENGFQVERAEDGRLCVKMLKEKRTGYYDLILMDIQMPDMNGYEASREIRKLEDERSKIPIIAMTANAFEEDKKKALDAGMDGHIAKPFDIQILLDMILEKCV